jgi:hypothetical protein
VPKKEKRGPHERRADGERILEFPGWGPIPTPIDLAKLIGPIEVVIDDDGRQIRVIINTVDLAEKCTVNFWVIIAREIFPEAFEIKTEDGNIAYGFDQDGRNEDKKYNKKYNIRFPIGYRIKQCFF